MHQLVHQEQGSLQVELAVAEIEEILKGWAKAFKDQDIVVASHSELMYSWNANAAGEILVHLFLIHYTEQLGWLSSDGQIEFDFFFVFNFLIHLHRMIDHYHSIVM